MKWQYKLAIGALGIVLVPPAFAAPLPTAGRVAVGASSPILLAQADQQRKDEHKGGGEHRAPQHRAPQQRAPQRQQIQRKMPQHQQMQRQPMQRKAPMQHQQMQRNAPQHQQMQRNAPQHQQMQRKAPQHQQMQRQMPQHQQMQRQQMQRKAPQHQQVQRNPRYNWNQYRPGQRPPNSQAHRNFSRGQWTRNYYAHRQYRGRPYVQPRGWFSRHWAFGMVLPRLFWTQHYWIADYADFGLANPPYGYVWVRYDNDALLVNVESGEILQAVYGLFNG